MSVFSSDEPLNTEQQTRGQSAWTPMRSKLRSWFQENAESLAPAYEGAVEILGNTSFPGRTHFIAHAVRDITNILVFALDQQLDGNRVEYASHLDKIQELWKSPRQISQLDALSVSLEEFTISMKLAKQIDDVIAEHRESRRRPSQYELLFRFLMKKNMSKANLSQQAVKAFKSTSKWFVSHAHFRARPFPPVEEREFVLRFEAFERAIYGLVESHLEGSYFIGIREIDDILQQANR